LSQRFGPDPGPRAAPLKDTLPYQPFIFSLTSVSEKKTVCSHLSQRKPKGSVRA